MPHKGQAWLEGNVHLGLVTEEKKAISDFLKESSVVVDQGGPERGPRLAAVVTRVGTVGCGVRAGEAPGPWTEGRGVSNEGNGKETPGKP